MYTAGYLKRISSARILALLVLLMCSAGLRAAGGDTLKVQSHKDVVIKTNPSVGYTDYPQWAVFPDTTKPYHKVFAYLTFECAPGLMCGEWDYLNYIYLGHKGGKKGDSLGYEIARFITPYGKYWHDGSGWKHGWYIDVTDFGMLMRDSMQVIYRHTGYEGTDRGWKINLTFYIVEGTPVREPVKITKLWDGSFQHGNASDPINNHLLPINVTMNPLTASGRLHIMQTGHGSDATSNCCEFASMTRTVKLDNTVLETGEVWRDNCGFNSLYPQAGTWIYDRANWCPGSTVRPRTLDFSLAGGSTHAVDMDMQAYTGSGSLGNYVITSYLMEYKAPAHTLDASMEAIISPSKEFEYLRYNPVCGMPAIVIKNEGTSALNSLTVTYGPKGGAKSVYNWTGNLAFLKTDTIVLTTPVQWGGATSGQFEVELSNPNGSVDQYPANDKSHSDFVLPPTYADKLILQLFTNKAASENSYSIRDANTGSVVLQRAVLQDETLYRDTLSLPNGCYLFEFLDTGTPPASNPLNKDGLSWWGNPNAGNGTFRIRNGHTGTTIRDFTASYNSNGYSVSGGDFGTKILQQFMVNTVINRIAPATPGQNSLLIYPNPSSGKFMLSTELASGPGKASLEIYSMLGEKVYASESKGSADIQVDLSYLPKGAYMVRMVTEKEQIIRRIILH